MPYNDIDWKKYCWAYLPTILIWTILASFLAMPEYGVISALVQSILLILWTYWGHRAAHIISAYPPFDTINPHISIHHNKSILLPRWLELVEEAIVNFFCFTFILILQAIFDVHIFSTSIVLGAAFLYITIHILDYSLRGNESHGHHHSRTFCNYSPEFLDTLLETRCDPEKPYTDMSPEIIHALFAFGLAYILKITFNLN